MMINIDNLPRFVHYILYLILFITGQAAASWGLFSTLHFKNLTMWQAYKKAIPFAWLDWIFMTLAINIGHKYDLVSPTQDIFVLIIIQFTLILLINQYYLKQAVFRSDIIAFFIIIVGFCVSFFKLLSKLLGKPVILKEKNDNNTKLKRYKAVTVEDIEQ
jgi:hypothetical protein